MSETDSKPETTPATGTDNASPLDLTDLKLMPDWVANFGQSQSLNRFEERERPGRGGRKDRRDGRGGPPRGDRRGPGQGRGDGDRRRPGGFGGGDRPRRDRDRDGRGPKGKGRGGPRDDRRPRGPRYEIPKDVTVSIDPADAALDALATHVRAATQAFSMFDASRLILSGGDRYRARFICDKERTTGLFGVTEGGGLFLSREEALASALTDEVMEKFYRVEEFEKEAPKGIFNSIGVCGFSGVLIGPPSHHSYQNNVRALHREKFSNMSIEDYKRRIKVENDPEVIEKWKEQEQTGHKWTYRPSEEGEEATPLTFERRADVEAHFRRTHGDEMVREMREVAVGGDVAKERLAPGLGVLMRQAVERAQKHLFEMSQKLGAGLERRGLKTFKRRSGKFYVSRTRPRPIPEGLVFADRLAQIVEMVKTGGGTPLKEILETLAPTPKANAIVEGLTNDQKAVLKDLHWLANEGYVIEYSDGVVFLGVQGDPSKPKAKKPKVEKPPTDSKEETSTPAPKAGPASAEDTAVSTASAKETTASPSSKVPVTEPIATADAEEESTSDSPEVDQPSSAAANDAPEPPEVVAEKPTDPAPSPEVPPQTAAEDATAPSDAGSDATETDDSSKTAV